MNGGCVNMIATIFDDEYGKCGDGVGMYGANGEFSSEELLRLIRTTM